MKKLSFILSVFVSLVLCSCNNNTSPSSNVSSTSINYYVPDVICLSFDYNNYDDFLDDYNLISEKFEFPVVVPNKELSEKLGIEYTIMGVGPLKENSNILDIERGVHYLSFKAKYWEVDYINDLEYSWEISFKYTSPVEFKKFDSSKIEYELAKDNRTITLTYDNIQFLTGEIYLGRDISNEKKEEFKEDFVKSLVLLS